MSETEDHSRWPSFMELDRSRNLPKGSAFRAFKKIESTLRPGRDYLLLHADTDAERIELLRVQRRVYPSSRNVVLLSPATAERIAGLLRAETAGSSQTGPRP